MWGLDDTVRGGPARLTYAGPIVAHRTGWVRLAVGIPMGALERPAPTVGDGARRTGARS